MTSGFLPQHSHSSHPSLWAGLVELLRNRIPETAFNTWFTHLHLAEVREDAWVIGVPNAFVLEYVEHHYRAVLEDAAGRMAEGPVPVRFVIAKAPDIDIFHPADAQGLRDEGEEEVSPVAGAAHGPVTIDSAIPLQARYTFDDFVIGECNQLAHAACLAVAEAP
jgi:chromosomal replication initiator protein